MRSWLGVVLLGAGLLAAQPVLAAGMSAKERDAKKACLSGDYATGVSILAELFLDTNDPTFLFNQGRCLEQNVRYVEAAERFREYLRKAGKLTAEEKAEVDKHIADCEAGAARSHAGASGGPAPAPPPAVQATGLPSGAPPVTEPPSFPLAQPGIATGSTGAGGEVRPWQHTAKWVAAGAAVAFLGLGVVEHARYYSKNKEYNDKINQCATTIGHCKDLADAADTAHIVAIVGYGAAAAATGLAITFWLMDKPASAPDEKIAVRCAPTLSGVGCMGSF
jgi:hypothetical protein